MPAMLTRSVRVSEPALRLADKSLAAQGTTLSRLVRDVVDYVARTGRVPALDDPASPALDSRMTEFESWADELTSSAPASPGYASASAKDLLAEALEERYG